MSDLSVTSTSLPQQLVSNNDFDPKFQRKAIWKRGICKVIRWLISGVLGGIIPLISSYAFSKIDVRVEYDFYKAIAHGELVLISSALTFGTLSEIIYSGKKKLAFLKSTTLILGVLLYVFQILYYNGQLPIAKSGNLNFVENCNFSLWIFGLSIGLGITHLCLAEVD